MPDPTTIYRRRYIGWLPLTVDAAALGVVGLFGLAPGAGWVIPLAGLMLVGAAVMFATMSVTVDASDIIVRFGPGIVYFKIPRGWIVMAESVEIPVWQALGIRAAPNGYVLAVRPGPGVRLRLGDGRVIVVGDPHLAGVIRPGIRAAIGDDSTTETLRR